MEILKPSTFHQSMSTNRGITGAPARWTEADNKLFEDALAVHDADSPDRWRDVAAMIPGKTVDDVIRQYNRLVDDVSSIEAGLVPIPGYEYNDDKWKVGSSKGVSGLESFRVLEWGEVGFDGFKECFGGNVGGGKRSRPSDHERKKGIPWTEKEHKLFLLGLNKYGKGDWRNISRNFVITRTPTQVASHAQKYFIRQLSGGKDKRRASIHDITTVNLSDNQTHSPENQNSLSPDHSTMLPHPCSSFSRPQFRWEHNNNQNNAMEVGFNPRNREFFLSPYNGMSLSGSFQFVGAQDMNFQINSAHLYPHG